MGSHIAFFCYEVNIRRCNYCPYCVGGGFEDESWHTDPTEQMVCDFAQCYSEETGQLGYHSSKFSTKDFIVVWLKLSIAHSYRFYEDCCYGHYEHDRLLDAVSGNRESFFGPSNAETLAATDPRSLNYSMPYIYDQFAWDHCHEDFDGYIAGTIKEKTARKHEK